MPYCPKCTKKLTKRKNAGIYVCQYHGYVRDIKSAPESYDEYADLDSYY